MKREKAARRVLPAIFWRKQAERDEAMTLLDKGHPVAKSPVTARRGVAVRKSMHVEDQGGLVDVVDEESDDEPVLIDDDSSDSQALEVNHAHETLARLRKGDFESIIVGRRVGPHDRQKKPRLQRDTARHRGPAKQKARRPALRQTYLDEQSLFAKPVQNSPQPPKIWQDQQRFSVDFDLVPLPCDLSTGRSFMRHCHALLAFLDNPEYDSARDLMCDGVPLNNDMSVDELLSALSTLSPDVGSLRFLSSFLSALSPVDVARVQNAITEFVREAALDTMTDRWWAIDVLSRLQRLLPTESSGALLKSTSIDALAALLSIGFDRAVRPLRHVLRGESLNGEINDETTIAWIALVNLFDRDPAWVMQLLVPALEQTFPDRTGPLAAERIWFLAFGLSAFAQFDSQGRTSTAYVAKPRWNLVQFASSMVTLTDETTLGHPELLRGRDRYIRIMMARCLALSATWKWSFDASAFSLVTRHLGSIFKNRQHRNLPTEPAVDFPEWITRFDIAQTANKPTKSAVAFDLYLKLVCVAASDMISQAASLSLAQAAERDIQRLIMSMIPVSAATCGAGQLINRYSMTVAACYFSPALLTWLLGTSQNWAPFETADMQSRQVSIRGLMYLAVACRHHDQPLQPIIARFAEILQVLTNEAAETPTIDANRTIVLVIACFRQMILHHSFDPMAPPVFPDPILLDNSMSVWRVKLTAQTGPNKSLTYL